MSTYLLDTGIVLGIIRNAGFASYTDVQYGIAQPENISVISVVTVGEILSLSFQFKWGEKKVNKLYDYLQKIPRIDISDPDIINRYAEIDSYSLNRYSGKKLPKGQTARTMGKNDIENIDNCSYTPKLAV